MSDRPIGRITFENSMTIMNILSDDEDNSNAQLPPDEVLLRAARSGAYTTVKTLLNGTSTSGLTPDVNCKGTQKANLGWTPLHLASYFGHFDVAELLLEHGAYVDSLNCEGDTPLHKAAYTGREVGAVFRSRMVVHPSGGDDKWCSFRL